jgi:pimeloyl-ACP methyl ester carboxylesterase
MLGISLACFGRPLAAEKLDRALVFIPGLYGSLLEAVDTEEVYWVSAFKLLFGSQSLHLCHDFSLDECPSLRAQRVLRDVSVIPFVYKVEANGDKIDRLKKIAHNKFEFSVFAYDWRQDITQTATRLTRYLRGLKDRYERVDVVGHSMGGYLLGYYLLCQDQGIESCRPNVGASVASNAVIVGTPFLGATTAFTNMVLGRTFAGNSKILSARAYGSFPSIFQLLPVYRGKILDEKLLSIDDAMMDVATWERERWGIFAQRQQISDLTRARRFVAEQLRIARRVRTVMQSDSESDPVLRRTRKLLVVQGQGQRTLDVVSYLGRKDDEPQIIRSVKQWKSQFPDRRPTVYADGDDTVTFESSAAPPALRRQMEVHEMSTNYSHNEMFEDEAVMQAIGDFLN